MFASGSDAESRWSRAKSHLRILEAPPWPLNLQLAFSLCWLEGEPSEVGVSEWRIDQGAVLRLIDREPLHPELHAQLG
jgi:hypothetical protein